MSKYKRREILRRRMVFGWRSKKKSNKTTEDNSQGGSFGNGFVASSRPEATQKESADRTLPPQGSNKSPPKPTARPADSEGNPGSKKRNTLVSIGFVQSCILVFVNFLGLLLWTFFFLCLKNDWNDIDEAISGFVTARTFPYAHAIIGLLILFDIIYLLLMWFYPLRNIFFLPGRGDGSLSVRLSLIAFIFNLILVPTLWVVGPVLIWRLAPQFMYGPVRFMETYLPLLYFGMIFVYGILTLPILLCWSNYVEKIHNEASRESEELDGDSGSYEPERKDRKGILANLKIWKMVPRRLGFSVFTLRIYILNCFLLLFVFLGAFFITLPIWFDSAHFLSTDSIPDKPKLIAHRGLKGSPENSLEAFKKALDHADVWAVETDVQVTLDGVLFLLHDDTLHRTTNIRDVFPDKIFQEASGFTFDELQQLDLRSGENAEKIPRLDQLFDILKGYPGKKVIFDLKGAKKGHPFEGDKLDPLLKKLVKEKGVEKQIIFLNLPKTYASEFPSSMIAKGLDAVDADDKRLSALKKDTKTGVNMEYLVPTTFVRKLSKSYGKEPPNNFRAFQKAVKKVSSGEIKPVIDDLKSAEATDEKPENVMWLCMYALSERYLFSQAWCLGMDAVIANSIDDFSHMESPLYVIKKSQRKYMYIGSLVSGVLFVLWIAIWATYRICRCLNQTFCGCCL